MAPNLTVRAEREKKVKALLAFASSLQNRLERASSDATIQSDLEFNIRALPLPASSVITTKQDELDKLGTSLWNLSTTILRRDVQDQDGSSRAQKIKRTCCLLRVFAFLLLDTAATQATKVKERKHSVRLLRVALKAARLCIQESELDGAVKVLERAADHQEHLQQNGDCDNDQSADVDEQDVACLCAQYYHLRTLLAWRQNRMDTAEHMFTKSRNLVHSIDPSTAEAFVEVLFDIGNGLLQKRNYELATRWLNRAYDILGEQDIELCSPEAGELRLTIMQTIVQVYLKLKTTEALTKAWDIVQLLETDYAEKTTVQLLKLELLSVSESMDTNLFYGVLLRIVRTVVLTETNFRTVIHHIHKLKDHSSVAACKILDQFIEIRLFPEENQNWIEKAVITRVWAGTGGPSSENDLETLQMLCDNVSRNTNQPLSAPATHAAQTLLWKKVEAAYSQDQFATAEAWCRLCVHSVFDKAGELNKTKIIRKMIMCALARQDHASARASFQRMSDTGREEPLTRYLMYKVALHSKDAQLAAECLEAVCKKSSKDATLLYACVLEAQGAGDKRQTINALEKALDKYDYNAPAGIHLPALLRCTARTLLSELVKEGKVCPGVMEEICKVFEGACAQAKSSRRRPTKPVQQLFTTAEFQWFAKNAYNLALKYCGEMPPACLVRLLEACAEFIILLGEVGVEDGDLILRLMFCDFFSSCAYVTMARAEDYVRESLQYYLRARKHCESYRVAADRELQNGTIASSVVPDVKTKYAQIVKLELEAALKLEDWDGLDKLLDNCLVHVDEGHLQTLADLVFVIQTFVQKAGPEGRHQSKVFKTLEKIIKLSWQQSHRDMDRISRWLRCLFQVALNIDESFSMQCIDQAGQLAAARHGVSSLFDGQACEYTPWTTPPSSSPVRLADAETKEANHYPPTELEWLATTSFNHAVDYYVQENDAKCKQWAEKAITLAQWAEDGGALRKLLMERYSGLMWKDGE
ncbi:SPO22-domain-containing protein [Sporormia fimetaria CBS 119925]|uniref:Protein ZIP4 homolog n=1 Tax=Sporormia fimetaria CBS 119925 TaxID=1340428 RepID=A0A6A6V5Q2_9PLEO|nr:SPO22-domain-containing protein [Sporormia fimetaria CBS 119925]